MIRKIFLSAVLSASCLFASAQWLAILSDIHVSPGNVNEGKLREAVAEINANESVDAVLMTGDLTNQGSDTELRNVKSILDGIAKPLYVIPGNHENNWSQSACKTFSDLWGTDRFVFELGDLVVIGMNCGPFMKMGDGHVKQEDLVWLGQTLKERVKPGKKVLSINHYPLLDDIDCVADYVRVLQQFPVITHQNGHYHQWKKYDTGGITGVMVRALDMRDGNYGYSLMNVDLAADSVRFFEKRLGAAPELKYAYRISTDFHEYAAPADDTPVPAPFVVETVYRKSASIFTRPGIDKDCIYFGNSLGNLVCIDKKTGEERWSYHTGGMLFSRPAVGKKYVVLPTSDKRLVWLDKLTGREVWSYASSGPYVADGVVKDGVLYQGGFKTFQAWDVDSHRLLWHYDAIDNYCQAAPVVDRNDVVFGAWDTNLRVLDRRTGALRWQWNNGVKQNLFSPGNVVPAVTRDKILIVAPDRYSTSLRRSDGKELWRVKNENKVRESLGLSRDGKRAYAKTMDGEVVVMDAKSDTYRLLWKTDLGFGYEHAPCIVLEHDGYVFLGSRRGMLAVVDAKTHQLVFSKQIGVGEVNGFELDEKGDVYCSVIGGNIVRISVKKR